MYRKIMDYLKKWKSSEHRKPLILQGARQVGKTYSILEFGRTCYENVAYFNFETNPKLNETFAENISPDYLIPILSHIAGQTIIREKTLIVFDEVQLCERALTSLKYFCEDAPEYHIIVAGSLLGVAVNRVKFSFPVGKVDMKTLYPMDMEEFMLASGEEQLVELIKKCFQTDTPMPAALHDAAMQLYRQYLVVGGMPECVMQFAKLCDKADAPLGALLYELQERHGSLLYKKEHFGGITAQDQKYADEIGEYSQAGIWTAHMIDTYLFFEYIEIFIEILIEACKDVRGHVFPWMYEFCKKRGINEIILNKML